MTAAQQPSREASLARTFVQIADTLVGEFDVSDLFDRLADACVGLLGAATAGIMLAEPGRGLQLMASSSAPMRSIELFEVTHEEGPCLDAYARHEQISIDLRDPAAVERWPRFTPRAVELGFTGVQALPMRLRSQTIGALNVFHTGDVRLGEHDTALAQALADVATIAILQRRALTDSQELTAQLQRALNDRVVIEQAKGVLSEHGGIDVDEAFVRLRDYCRRRQLPLTATARELVDARRLPDEVLLDR